MNKSVSLKRSLSITHLVLYGLGTTIGAGIYVLIGVAAGRAGYYAPLSFLLASLIMAFSGASFGELAGRFPVSAGEAAYVKAGFGLQWLSTIIGIMVVTTGIVSASTISVGSIGYIQHFLDLPSTLLLVITVLAMGAVASFGILESVSMAALFTIIEVLGLMVIIVAGFAFEQEGVYIVTRLGETIPSLTDSAAWVGIASAGLLAFFAFVGFEDLVNVAEEAKNPAKAMPWAIGLTLLITTVIYMLVCLVAIFSTPIEELGASKAPLNLVFQNVTSWNPVVITAIAIVATLNGVIVQMIMGSRVLYGLAKQGSLPKLLGYVNPWTRTPLLSTALVVGIILTLSLAFELTALAEMTSRLTLIVFATVNLSLVRIKLRKDPTTKNTFIVPIAVPILGFLFCLFVLGIELFLI